MNVHIIRLLRGVSVAKYEIILLVLILDNAIIIEYQNNYTNRQEREAMLQYTFMRNCDCYLHIFLVRFDHFLKTLNI